MKPLGPCRKGPRNLRAWLNALRDAVIANRPLRSETCELYETPGGTQIIPNADAIAAASSAALLPLQPVNASSGATPKIRVVNGTFGANAEATAGAGVPTIGGTRIDAATAPLLTISASSRLIYLQVDVDTEGLITGCSVESTTSDDPPAGDESTLYVRLATVTVTVASGVASVAVGVPNLRGSQTYEQCGGVAHNHWLA